MNRKKVLQKLGVTSLFALVFVAGLIVSPMIGQLAFPKTVGRLQVEIYPKNVTLFKGETETFYAMVYNGSGNYQYEWSVNGTITWHEALYEFSFLEACKIVVLSVFVQDSEGNTGYASEIVYDPIATGSYYLDVPLPLATYHIGQFTNNSVFAVNGSNWDCFLVSDNASYVSEMVTGNMTTSGGKVIWGSGDYNFTSKIYIGSNTVWEGHGRSTKFLAEETKANLRGLVENTHIFSSTLDENITIRNIWFDHPNGIGGTANTNCAITMVGVQHVTVEQCLFTNFRAHAMRFLGDTTSGNYTRHIKVLNCEAHTLGYNLIAFGAYNDGDFQFGKAIGNTISDVDTGIACVNAWDVTISENDIYNCTQSGVVTNHIGIAFEGSAGRSNRRITISNNNFGYSKAGISFIANGQTNHEITIDSNTFVGHTGATSLSGGTTTSYNIIVSNNVIDGSSLSDTLLNSYAVSGTITGNTFIGGEYRGLQIYGSNLILANNVYYNQSESLQLATASHNISVHNEVFKQVSKAGTAINVFGDFNTVQDCYFDKFNTGILLNAGADNNHVEENRFGDVTTKINDGGANNFIRWNEGYVTENSGFTTIANMENVAHGLVGTPVFLQVTALNATYDTEPLIAYGNITAFDSTYFGVSCYWLNTTAITDDVIYICWEARTWN